MFKTSPVPELCDQESLLLLLFLLSPSEFYQGMPALIKISV